MHIITRKRLNEFAHKHPDTKASLVHWYKLMKRGNFCSFVELQTVFPHADQVKKIDGFQHWWEQGPSYRGNTLQPTENLYSCGTNA